MNDPGEELFKFLKDNVKGHPYIEYEIVDNIDTGCFYNCFKFKYHDVKLVIYKSVPIYIEEIKSENSFRIFYNKTFFIVKEANLIYTLYKKLGF